MNKKINTLKIMKKIIYISVLLITFAFFSSCDNDDIDTPVLTTDEYPRILGRWPDRTDNGALGNFEIPLNQILVIDVQYTPSALCEGTWYIDGREVHKGVGLEYTPSTEGTFHLKLVVKTPTLETSREANIVVVAATPE